MAATGTALATALGDVADAAMGTIQSVLPVVLPIMGAIVVVTIGIKLFRRFAK